MIALAQRVVLSSGLFRALIAMLAGASGALALAPFNFWPIMLVPMCCAVWLLDGVAPGPKRFSAAPLLGAAWIGWLWGFGAFVAGLWWLGAAFLVEGERFAALLPLGVIGLPAVLALFPALGFTAARALWSAGAGRIGALAFGLAGSEWLRGHIFTGFPWNEPGMALGGQLYFAQIASLVGLYGLNVLCILIFAAPALLIAPQMLRRGALLPLAALLGLALFGFARVSLTQPAFVPGVTLRLLQPNVAIDANFRPEAKMEIVRKYLALSDRAKSASAMGIGDITHLIWPESSLPTILSRDAEVLSAIGGFLPAKTVLVVGAARMEDAAAIGGAPRYFNSLQVVGAGGVVKDSYDKVHLVPFGEYLPFEGALRAIGLTQFVQMPGGFSAGHLRSLFNVPGLPPVAPLICYEAIFPGEVVPEGKRPGLMLNVTVDTWYGDTPGPYQHLAQARLRAIEEGLPLIRDANSGISAVIDPVGRIVAQLPLNVEDVLDSKLPKALSWTLYGLAGDWIFAAMLIASAAMALLGKRQR